MRLILPAVLFCCLQAVDVSAQPLPYLDPALPLEPRVSDLLGRMTASEKVTQLVHGSAAVPRLGVPEYNWWNEALHGVARGSRATVFPQAIGLAATFDDDLLERIGTAIGTEGRAIYHAAVHKGNRLQYSGLTYWSPNINIFRDPRWGRGQETYGEDPFLTARLGTAFVRGIQGDHPRYLRAAACAKHFVMHSGPESGKEFVNPYTNAQDFYETYTPAFRALIDAGVAGLMCAYNQFDSAACCGNKALLTGIVRERFGFKGYIVSDCWAIYNIHHMQKLAPTELDGAIQALRAGVNVDCGNAFLKLDEALAQGRIRESELDQALAPLLRTRFRLGMFDPDSLNPYAAIPTSVVNSAEHRALAREAAQKSIVLLKNNGALPLDKNTRRVYTIGPNAASIQALLGNYYGISPNMSTVAEGVAAKVEPGNFVGYDMGCLLDAPGNSSWSTWEAMQSDVIIAVMGLQNILEGEGGEGIAASDRGDRGSLQLPSNQLEFIRHLRKNFSKPLVLVLTGGGPVILPPNIVEGADAILYAWYPGEAGGEAVADLLFGDAVPSGRLPITFPRSLEQLPPITDYRMTGRTYRYMTEEPLFPFGFGLSYTRFEYSDLKTEKTGGRSGDSIRITVTVANTGQRAAEEVVQVYLSLPDAPAPQPRYSLCAVRRVPLQAGEKRIISFMLPPAAFTYVDGAGNTQPYRGTAQVQVGACSPGARGVALGAPKLLDGVFQIGK